jgi:hypothetical protein
MKIRWIGGIAALAVVATAFVSSEAANAQFNAGAGQGRGTNNRPTPKNYFVNLKTIGDDLGKKYQARVLVDPTIFVAAIPKAPASDLEIDKALDDLASRIKNTTWRRVYLNVSQASIIPSPLKLSDTVRALDQLEQTGLVLENPTTKKAITFTKNYNVTQNFANELKDGQFVTVPIYIFYSTVGGAEGKTMEEKFVDLQRQQMEMMLQMTPDQMAQSMAAGMQMFSQMDPSTRSQFMGNMMKASMQMFQQMSPEDRNAMMQSAMQAFSQSGFGGPGGGGKP